MNSERTIVRIIWTLLILFNIKYVFYIVQIPYTFFFVDYKNLSSFSKDVALIKNNKGELSKERYVGFISDVKPNDVLNKESSVRNFYTAQYAIVPSILENDTGDTEQKYVIGMFEKNTKVHGDFEVYKKLSNKVYIFKKIKTAGGA